jgi:Ca2+-binding RTX toxin-like protein
LGSSGREEANTLSTGADGSIYVSGYTTGNLDGQTKSGSLDAFITKYNADGTKVWTKLLGSLGYDQAHDVTTDSNGDVYIAGYTEGNLDGQTKSGNGDAFITKLVVNNSTFTGTSNADTLIGINGADILIGLAGNDTYTVNNVGDIVIEALNAGTDLINASISYTLPNNVENLTLTGSSNINGTGNSLNNTLTGNSGNNTLTGGIGSDIFVFQFGQSPVSGADRITDFAIGTDRIDLLSSSGGVLAAPTSFGRAADSTATTLTNVVNSVFTDANGGLTGNQALGVNSAALVQVTTVAIAGTYLVINDSTAGFQSSNDLLINITGFTGTLPALGDITVSNFFI